MDTNLLMALIAAALGAGLLAYAVVRMALRTRESLSTGMTAGGSLRALLVPFGAMIERRRGNDRELDRALTRLERMVVQAGGRFLEGATGAEIFAARFVMPFLAILFFAVIGLVLRLPGAFMLPLALVFAVMLYLWPEQALGDAARTRVARFSRDLPPSLDVMRLISQSGGDLGMAIRTVVEVSPDGPVREELSRAIGEVAIGTSLSVALNRVAERIDSSDANAVFSTMAQALEMGTSVSDNLGAASALIRKAQRTRAQERAQKAVVAMTFPLLLLILPGVFIVLFAPMLIQFAGK